jgi:hypothetical protein
MTLFDPRLAQPRTQRRLAHSSQLLLNFATGKQLDVVRPDIDAIRHESRNCTGTGVLELPSSLPSETAASELIQYVKLLCYRAASSRTPES